jgi:N utilization substance protein A
MQQDLNRVIEQVSKEKGIDKSILISALENAMISAAKKTFGHQRKIEAQFNPEIGEVELFEAKTVVENVQDPAVEVTLQEAREAMSS